jgi:hypothetical protein
MQKGSAVSGPLSGWIGSGGHPSHFNRPHGLFLGSDYGECERDEEACPSTPFSGDIGRSETRRITSA